MSQGDNIRMKQFLHYLQFTILVPLVLVHFLNSNDITSLWYCSLYRLVKGQVSSMPINLGFCLCGKKIV